MHIDLLLLVGKCKHVKIVYVFLKCIEVTTIFIEYRFGVIDLIAELVRAVVLSQSPLQLLLYQRFKLLFFYK